MAILSQGRVAALRDRAMHRAFRIGAWFFRSRYRLLSWLIGLRPEGGPDSPRGTLIIQIDGLGHERLLQAMDRGYMPFTRHLVHSGHYRLHRWRCGIASDTPPIQSGLFFGTSEGIMGFYWWDRRAQKRVIGANPYDMQRVQASLVARTRYAGLLAGGSSYCNVMSGGARYAVLSIAGANPHWFKPGQGLLRALAILALNPGKVVRFAFDAMWELLQEMEDRAFVNAMDRPRVLEGAFPIVRLLLNVVAREVATAGARLDMLRGVPVIYACYFGYDIVAHHSGPLSRNSLRVLRGIDGAIRKLLDTRAWTERRYDVLLLSDHGMSPCQPVAEAFDHDFEDWVEAWWRQGAQASPRFRARRRDRRRGRRQGRQNRGWLGTLAGAVTRHGSAWLRTWGRIGAWLLELGSAGAIKLGERFLEEPGDPDAPRITITCCGPLAQLWVREVDQRLDLSVIESLCPGFLQALIDHPAVEVVIGREGEHIVVQGRRGRLLLRPLPRDQRAAAATSQGQASIGALAEAVILRVDGQNPLLVYEEPAVAALQIAEFTAMEACGDVICFAASFHPETLRDTTPGAVGEPHFYSFENQLGTHASIGGDQSYPFLLTPASVSFDPSGVISAADLHPFLRAFVERR